MSQTYRKISAIIIFFFMVFGFGIMNEIIKENIASYAIDSTEYLQLSYLRMFLFALVFNVGFTLFGIMIMKRGIHEKKPHSKLYMSFKKGINLLYIVHGLSWTYLGLVIGLFLLRIPFIEVQNLQSFMTYFVPIITVLIVMFYGRDTTFVMDKDR